MNRNQETEEYVMTLPKLKKSIDLTGKTFVETHKNDEMAGMLTAMEPYLERATGKFGYAIARNVRKIKEACEEYLQMRQNLITEFGEEETDENGNKTGIIGIRIGTEAFQNFTKRLEEFAGIQHSVEIYKVSYGTLPKDMTARDMLQLEWMLIEDGEEQERTGEDKG